MPLKLRGDLHGPHAGVSIRHSYVIWSPLVEKARVAERLDVSPAGPAEKRVAGAGPVPSAKWRATVAASSAAPYRATSSSQPRIARELPDAARPRRMVEPVA